jgi:hypothetical protein
MPLFEERAQALRRLPERLRRCNPSTTLSANQCPLERRKILLVSPLSRLETLPGLVVYQPEATSGRREPQVRVVDPQKQAVLRP